MAYITVGIDTSRTYNKKQPPGGACADLFGGSQDRPNPRDGAQEKKLNRMLSNVELASEQEVCEQPTKKIDKTEEVKKPRIQRKSQPSVCPVTGETIGHNLATIEPVDKREVVKQEEKMADKKETAVKMDEKAKPEPKAVSSPESVPSPAVNTPEPAANTPYVTEVITATAAPAPAEVKSAQQPSSTVMPPSSPSPTPSPPQNQKPVVSTPTPAPVKTRRVPPGGHTTAFW